MLFSHGDLHFEFSSKCLEELASRRQRSFLGREIGGQLFARIEGLHFQVARATVTRGNSKRSRFGFWPDRAAERSDIEQMFRQGLHYVGDWHTHPEAAPTPSATDRDEMLDIFQQSRHELPAMLLVIVGQEHFPGGIYVGAVSSGRLTRLLTK